MNTKGVSEIALQRPLDSDSPEGERKLMNNCWRIHQAARDCDYPATIDRVARQQEEQIHMSRRQSEVEKVKESALRLSPDELQQLLRTLPLQQAVFSLSKRD